MAKAFQKIKSAVNRGITTISVKTSSSLEKSKINMHIDSLSNEISKLIMLIGEKTYENWINNSSLTDGTVDLLESVKRKKEEIIGLKEELQSIDDRDNQILGNTTEVSTGDNSTVICPNCNSKYDEPVKFCRKCGTKLQ